MKKVIFTIALIAFTLSAAAQTTGYKPKTFNDSASYAIGKDMYRAWNQQGIGIDVEAVANALLNSKAGEEAWSDSLMQNLLMRFQQAVEERQRARVQENIKKGEEFLAKNKLNKGVKTTESGLQYKLVSSGNGKHPAATDVVKVHYTGKLIDGTTFDSSVERGEPITFPLQQVIPGWSEGVQLMDEGSTYMLYIPHNLAYGEQQAGIIPPGSVIIFEVQLLEINPKEEGAE
ncbi:MAG: FKBP-type peptidyl-prolyl cis-trans isomerase [Bacteroidales bacterium]|nr:FKBP-type peptidyl-prolyl cis-trans isomerase [Bacteroidales bacterium]